jgi:membrane protein DedA with SNARE-associated domain
MNITIGSLVTVAFFVALISSFCAFYVGYRIGVRVREITPKAPVLTEEQQRKAKEMAQGWQNILNYDAGVARGDK